MKISSAFPSNYLKAADLNGQPLTLTIAKVILEQVGRGQDQQPVVYFRGQLKGMVLNKTNAKKISEVFGDDTDNWVGGEIVLFEAMVEFQGDTVAALRVRNVPSKQPFAEDRSETRARPATSTKPLAGGQSASLLAEAEAMTRGGISAFRDWRDRLGAEEYQMLSAHMGRLHEMANQVKPELLSETAKKVMKKSPPAEGDQSTA